MSYALPGFNASAAIARCRFVRQSGEFTVAQCVANEVALGASPEGTREAPIPGASANAAEVGDPLRIYTLGDVCEIEVGSAVTFGQFVKPDANGRAVPAVANDRYSAQCLRGQATATNRGLFLICRGIV